MRHILAVVGVLLAAVEEHSWNSWLVPTRLLPLPVRYQSPPGSSSSIVEKLSGSQSESLRHWDPAELVKSVVVREVVVIVSHM